jgi:hypothetical protein
LGHATSNIIANPVEALSSVNVLNKYAMLKCDTKEVSKAFQDFVENFLEKDCNWVNTGKTESARKKEGNSKSNFKKVIECCMTLLSKEELAIRNTKQPKGRPERSLWAGIFLILSNAVHKKLMSHLLTERKTWYPPTLGGKRKEKARFYSRQPGKKNQCLEDYGNKTGWSIRTGEN